MRFSFFHFYLDACIIAGGWREEMTEYEVFRKGTRQFVRFFRRSHLDNVQRRMYSGEYNFSFLPPQSAAGKRNMYVRKETVFDA